MPAKARGTITLIPMEIKGRLVDIPNRATYGAIVTVSDDGYITAIDREPALEAWDKHSPYILPGFVDAHVHIESSMLLPVEFAKLAVTHGTVATVSDPHEIANVLGMEGVEYMLDNAQHTPLSINFGAPSCVPATTFETAARASAWRRSLPYSTGRTSVTSAR